MYVHDTNESIFLKINIFKFQDGHQNPKWLPKCHKFALSGISLYEKELNANKYEWIIAPVENVLILWHYCFKYITKMAAKIQNSCQISIFYHIFCLKKWLILINYEWIDATFNEYQFNNTY